MAPPRPFLNLVQHDPIEKFGCNEVWSLLKRDLGKLTMRNMPIHLCDPAQRISSIEEKTLPLDARFFREVHYEICMCHSQKLSKC